MIFAKLENNMLVLSPGVVKITGTTVYNPTKEQLRELGYKEVLYPDTPADRSVDVPGQPAPQTPATPIRVDYTEDEEYIYVSFVPEEPVPEADPALLRKQAYRAEADQHLIAYEGYMLEGCTAEAEEQKVLYLAKKVAIREQHPNHK